MGSLEESSPDGHGVSVSTIVFEVATRSSIAPPVVAGCALLYLLRNYWIICDRNADPEWTTIMFAAWASPFASFESSAIKFVVELLWIGDFRCINADAVIVFSISGTKVTGFWFASRG